MICNQCGSPVKEGARFCGSCGVPIQAAPKTPQEHCASCSVPLAPEARFCHNCGATTIAAHNSERQDALPAPSTYASAPAADVSTQPMPSYDAPPPFQPEAPAPPANTSAQPPYPMPAYGAPPPGPFGRQEQNTGSIQPPYPQPPMAQPGSAPPTPGYRDTSAPYYGMPDMRGDKPVKGNNTAAIAIISSLLVVCVGLACAFIFDLFGFRTLVGGAIPALAPKDSVSQQEEQSESSSSASRSQAAQSQASPSSSPPASREESKPGAVSNSRFQVELIEPMFEEVCDFEENGLARVSYNYGWGVIDRTGNFVVEPIYDYIWGFTDDEHALFELDGKYGLLDTKGNVVIEPVWDDAYSIYEDLIPVCRDGKYGYIDLDGNIVIPLQFADAYSFQEGFAVAMNDFGTFFIDLRGNVVSPYYEDAGSFCEGYAHVMMNGKWGYVDQSFNIVVPCVYDYVYGFEQGVSIAYRENEDKYLFVDTAGQEVTPLFDDLFNVTNGYAIIMEDGLYGLIDGYTFESVIPPIYDDIYDFGDGLIPVTTDSVSWYYVDTDNIPSLDMEFDLAYSFYEGLAQVLLGQNWGVIDNEGNLVSEYQWEEVGACSNGMIAVCKNGSWGYLRVTEK